MIPSDPSLKYKDPSEVISYIKRRVKAEVTDQGLRSKKANLVSQLYQFYGKLISLLLFITNFNIILL